MKTLKMKSQSENDQGLSVQKLIAATNPTKLAYEILINKKSARPKKSQEKWVRDCKLQAVEDLNWTFIYSLPRICTVSTEFPVQIPPQTYSNEFLSFQNSNIGYSSLLSECAKQTRKH